MKYYAIGDIHGCILPLRNLIKKLPLQSDDVLVFLGDYMDRGDYSYEVMEYLLDLKNEFPNNIKLLMGNHDQMYLLSNDRTIDDKRYIIDTWMMNGGNKTIKSFENNNKKLDIFVMK